MRPPLFGLAAVAIVAAACNAREDARSEEEFRIAAHAAMLTLMADSADSSLRQSPEPGDRAYCIAVTHESHDPPEETLRAVERPGRRVLPISQCDGFQTVDGQLAGRLWVDQADPVVEITGGFLLGIHWGRGYGCTIRRDGEAVLLDACQIFEDY